MRKTKGLRERVKSFGAAVVVAASVGPAAAEGPYVSALGGLTIKAKDEWSIGGASGAGDIRNGSGFVVGGALGYAFEGTPIGRLRIEGEVSYASSDVTGVNGAGASPFPAAGETRTIAGMANLRVDLGDVSFGETRIAPYVGGGAGVASVKVDYAVDGAFVAIVPTPFPLIIDDDDLGFAWQALAGLDAAVSDRVSLFIEGRYVGVPNVTVANPSFGDLETERNRAAVLIGFRVGL